MDNQANMTVGDPASPRHPLCWILKGNTNIRHRGRKVVYSNSTSGDVPEPRRGFCADIVWAKDQSSCNMSVIILDLPLSHCAHYYSYLFGGFRADGSGLGDLYVLSIPSFRWIAVSTRQRSSLSLLILADMADSKAAGIPWW